MGTKIGIGVTHTTNRSYLQRHFDRYKMDGAKLHIECDNPSIAAAKNNCIWALKECDYIFLFDDDCFPSTDNWADFFIQAHLDTGSHHFLFMNDTLHGIPQRDDTGVLHYENAGGPFLFITKEVVQRVGYMNEKYKFYGFEHSDYSRRIFRAGLSPVLYPCMSGTSTHIEAMDYKMYVYHAHHSSMINRIADLSEILSHNKKLFNQSSKDPIFVPKHQTE